jgi:excisionase family DNA binding protein
MKAGQTTTPGAQTAGRKVAPDPLPAKDGCGSGGPGLLHAPKLTAPQAAKRLGIGETKVRALVKEGRIPVILIDGKVLLLETDLEGFLRERYGRLKASRAGIAPAPMRLSRRLEESGLLKNVS